MAVYEGVLEKLSGGEIISSEGTGGYFTDRGINITRYHKTGVDPHAGWVQHQFADVGGVRIKNVVVNRYQDALLAEAVGQQVAISLTGPPASSGGRHTVIAVRTPQGGIDRPSGNSLLVGSIWLVVKHWITAPLFFLIMLIPAWMASLIQSSLGSIVVVLAAGLSIWWMVVPFVAIRRTVGAAGALDKAPWTSLARTG